MRRSSVDRPLCVHFQLFFVPLRLLVAVNVTVLPSGFVLVMRFGTVTPPRITVDTTGLSALMLPPTVTLTVTTPAGVDSCCSQVRSTCHTTLLSCSDEVADQRVRIPSAGKGFTWFPQRFPFPSFV